MDIKDNEISPNTRTTCEEDLLATQDALLIFTISNNSLRAENTQLKTDKDQLTAQLTELQNDKDQLQTQLTELQNDKDQLTAQLNDSNTTIVTLTSEIDDLNTQLNELQNDKDQLQTQLTELQNDKDQLTAQLNDSNTTIANLNDQITSLTSEIDDLNTQLNELQNDKDQLQTQLNGSNTTIVNLNDQITSLISEIESLNAQLNAISNLDLNDELNFFSLGKSSWDKTNKKFFIELGLKEPDNSFKINENTYTVEKNIQDENARYIVKKDDVKIFEITGKSDEIDIITKNVESDQNKPEDNRLFFELSNIEKLQDLKNFQSTIIDERSDGAEKLSDTLFIIKTYTSAEKIYYFNRLRAI